MDRRIRLADGRWLGFGEYGDEGGKACFFFHGWPGSRLEARPAEPVALRLGVRLIALDRPGYGLSDFRPGRAITDWPGDVAEVADALGIERFGVVGLSGGGPYAAACAHALPQRLTAAAIVSGLGPLDAPAATRGMSQRMRYLLKAARRAPWLLRLPIWEMDRRVRRSPERYILQLSAGLGERDRALLVRPEISQMMAQNVSEALRVGRRGVAWDGRLYVRPWGFRLEDIGVEVDLWQGEDDRTVPPEMGRYQSRAMPLCRGRFLSGEGHFLIFDHWDEILGAIASRF